MYDACDEHEVKAPLGLFRKRLDARRNTKPKKPDAQLLVCTPFDPSAFNFTKIKDPREKILTPLLLNNAPYEILTNKFPLFAGHMLLVSKLPVAQQMTSAHLGAIAELLQSCSMSAYFNSWCASASVNHFHCHLIDEVPPVATLPLVPGATVLGRLRHRLVCPSCRCAASSRATRRCAGASAASTPTTAWRGSARAGTSRRRKRMGAPRRGGRGC